MIAGQREELLRNNERFMRELRRRHEEERKVFVEKTLAKKEAPVKVAEVKKDD